jgi:hypothetical protein
MATQRKTGQAPVIHQRLIALWTALLLAMLIIAGALDRASAAEPVEVGYRAFSYDSPSGAVRDPTGEKPESKLWYTNDGIWWGSLFHAASESYHIYRFNRSTRAWEDTGVVLDDRPASRADTLWDGQRLYVVSHIFTTSGAADSNPARWGRLYRFSYHPATQTYTKDFGPVTVTKGRSETLVIDKDSTGQLWVTYVEANKVMVNRSLGADDVWGDPFVLPTTGATGLKSDDIASVIAFGGNKIGILWSNQNTKTMNFSVHHDDAPDTTWTSTAAVYAPGGSAADDHINLKSLQTDGDRNLFAVVKTSFSNSSQPNIVLLACVNNTSCTVKEDWRWYTVYTNAQNQTRPLLLIDTSNRDLHVFTAPTGGGAIYHKVSDMDAISFTAGAGTPFIRSSEEVDINNPTSTKQTVNAATGIVVLASDDDNGKVYLHNYRDLSGSLPTPVTPTTTATAVPTPTPTPTASPVPELSERTYLPVIGQ